MTLVTSIALRDWVKIWKSGRCRFGNIIDHHHDKSSCRSYQWSIGNTMCTVWMYFLLHSKGGTNVERMAVQCLELGCIGLYKYHLHHHHETIDWMAWPSVAFTLFFLLSLTFRLNRHKIGFNMSKLLILEFHRTGYMVHASNNFNLKLSTSYLNIDNIIHICNRYIHIFSLSTSLGFWDFSSV